MSWSKKIMIGLLVVLVALQFVPLDRSNPEITGVVDAPPEVLTIFERACYDCHSNQVNWPWYSWVAPVSFWVTHDVEEGREHLNFSEWDKLTPKKQNKKREECWEEVEEGEMPLPNYLRLHPEAKLSPEERETLRLWSTGA